MLIPFASIHAKYHLRISGIVHVGAHYAEEHKDYIREGVTRVAYIEASLPNYTRLCRISLPGDVVLHHVALADYEGHTEMYTETANQGQSSSLLKPGTHTTHYPSIQFTGREVVKVTTLDKLKLTGYNMLNLDVQGAELLVLKGGTRTLEEIEYIYTEVNREAVYEGCAQIGEIDALLIPLGFTRVETVWTEQGWGDAFYVRTSGRNIVSVPAYLQPKMPFPYPSDNHVEFERWFYENTKAGEVVGRTYLPIFWTAYYVRAKYGKDKSANERLQGFLNKLPRNRKYFTIVQYDDGILADLKDLDIKIFGMSGGRIDYPLPLICQPHPALNPVPKDIFCSFVGTITHPIRAEIVSQLSGKPGYYISTKAHTMKQFCEILNRSRFVLAPRGYGPSSFRIQEALQYGAVPVYISDSWIEPHNQDGFMWRLKPGDNVDEFLNEMAGIITEQNCMESYQNYFTYSANKQLILENI